MAFNCLKEAITSAPVLIQPDENKPYTIETDASDFGYSMTLYQKKLHPIMFDGKKLQVSELNYLTYEKELLVIKRALTNR